MSVVLGSTGRWAVSARPTGEVFVARCDAGDISVVRFGSGPAADAEVERQISDLIDASRDAAMRFPSSGPIPSLVHQVLARMLASDVPISGGVLIVFDDGRDVTVATIGEVDGRLQLDGSDTRLPWVRVRDRSGHEARVYPILLDRRSAFSLQWPQNRESGAHGVEVDARWPESIVDAPSETLDAVDHVPPLAEPVSASDVPSYVQDDRAREVREDDGLSEEKGGFLQWFDRMRGRPRQGAGSVDRVASERVPPSPEPEWLTGAAVDLEAVHAPDVPPGALVGHAVNEPAVEDDRLTPELGHAPMVEVGHTPTSEVVRENEPEAVPPRATLPPRRPAWPEPERLSPPLWRKTWVWGVLVAALLCAGVLLANFANRSAQPGKSLIAAFGPHFTATINSRPPGAWIAIDGHDTGRLTPATLELPPGEHQVMLTIAGKGSATVPVRGERNGRASIEAALYGAVRVTSADPRVPVAVALDGLERGYAPVLVEDLLPGPHEIHFRAPGMDPWTETFEVKVGQTQDAVARPFAMPDKGVIEIRTTLSGDGVAEPLKGATVYIDGESRGTTPARIDLPHGPHSIRVAYHDEELPVQVIDLPGGNHLFADFAFGSGKETPRMVQTSSSGPISRDQPAVVTTALTGIAESELREMWLNVRSPDRTWKRYEMTLLRAAGGVVGVAVFPPNMIGADGSATYYTNAVMQLGDEYFTELQTGRREPRSTAKTGRVGRTALSPADPIPPSTPSAGAETP
jgi:hypothetical protein